MGSIMDSRYWTCPHCCTQFDWEDGSAQAHDADKCAERRPPAGYTAEELDRDNPYNAWMRDVEV